MTTNAVSALSPVGGPAAEAGVALLSLRGIDKHFGPVQALADVSFDVPAGQVTALIGAGLAALFLARGAIGYTAGWRAQFPEEPFATLDRRNYSPLSLFIGVGFLLLVLMRLI